MRLEQLRAYALSLPGTIEQPHFDFGAFRVKGRIFVTTPPDGGFAHVFVDDMQRERALALYPAVVEALHWGSKTVGVRIALAKARPAFVRGLVHQAWARKLPRALAAQVPAPA